MAAALASPRDPGSATAPAIALGVAGPAAPLNLTVVHTGVVLMRLLAAGSAWLLRARRATAAMLLIIAAVCGQLRRRGALRQLALGALMPGLAFLFGDLGLARTSASSASLLLAAEPLLSVLLAVVVLGERLSGRAAAR